LKGQKSRGIGSRVEEVEKKEENIIFKGKTDAIYKIIVVGDPAVGKMSLLSKFATNQFEEKYLPTVGVSILKEPIELKDEDAGVTLMFWIIAGQPQFYMLHRPYFNGADGMLLVFDTTRSSTFSNVNNWYSSAVKYGLSGIPRILIGNKVDLKDERKIIQPMAEHLSEKLNAPYFETSALTGENIKVVFNKIAELIYRGQEPYEARRREEEQNFSYRVRIEKLDNSRSGGSLCYIDQKVVEKLQLMTGSVIEIKGNKRTTGIVIPSIKDMGKNIIRLNNLQQLNAGAKVGDFIRINKAAVYLAEEIELSPTGANSGLLIQKEAIKTKLINKPVVKGDIIDILGDSYQESDPEDQVNHIMKLFSKSPRKKKKIGSMRMVVEKTLPSIGIVKITRDTKVRVNNCIAILNKRGEIVSYEDPVSSIEDDSEYRKVIEDLLSYTGRLEGRIRNIETEKQVLNLERKKLEYGKRILNNAIERLIKITDKLLESPLFSKARYGNLESNREEEGFSELRNLEELNKNLTRLERLISDNSSEEYSQNRGYCEYCGEEVEDNQIHCRHCGTRVN